MDFYLDYNNCLNRLYTEYEKYGSIIIAYDFDDTIYNFHKIEDRNYNNIINLLKECKRLNIGKFICFTASPKERYSFIWDYVKENNIPCDKVNEGFDGMPDGRKVYYNILLDDRAGLITSYNLLNDLVQIIKSKKAR